METKSTVLKWNQEDFPKFVLEALKKLNIVSKNTKNLNLNFDIDDYCRYFIYNNFQIEILAGENDFFEFKALALPKSFDIRYGCELETCFVLNCKTNEYNDFLSKNIKDKKDEKSYEKKIEKWTDLIKFHIKTNLAPYFTKEFLKRFPYAYIMPYHSEDAVYIDLASGEEIFKHKEVDAYKTLQFAQDASVKCGDTDNSDTSLSVHCEIISPILKDISEIKLIYENIISEACNSSNSSAGYHVNVSIVDTSGSGEPIEVKLTPGILLEIVKRWYPFEKKHYTEYRGQGTVYAANMSEIVDDVDFMQAIYEHIGNNNISSVQIAGSENVITKKISESEILSSPNKFGLRNLFYLNQINDKYTSLHRKPNTNILEFRVFPSKNKMDLLIDYTKKAIGIIEKSFKYVLDNSDKISYEYNYLKSTYQESPYYDFNLYQYTNYKGSFKTFQKLAKRINDIDDVLIFFNKFTTKVEVEEIQETTFLFFFKEKNIVKIKKKFTGLIPGDHKYKFKTKFVKQTLRVNYLPEQDFIEISDFTKKFLNEYYDE
jgi:hypothetical protein